MTRRPRPKFAAEKNRQQADAAASGAAAASDDVADEATVTARGTDGRTYSCSAGVLDRIDAAKDRITRREKVLKARRAAVREIEKQYPNGEAPSEVVASYDELFARTNAQVTWTNRAIAGYNRLLREACEPS